MKTTSPFLARLMDSKNVQASVKIEITDQQSRFLNRASAPGKASDQRTVKVSSNKTTRKR